MIDQAVTGNNVIVCKSLSKSLALPGLRFGYCFSHPELIKRIQDVRPSGPASSVITELGLDLFNLTNDHIARMLETRNYIEEIYDCVPSQSNFVLFKNPEPFLDYVQYRKIENLHRMSLTDLNTFKYYEAISKI
jgi:threonine-phosphate decarboxylase